MDTDRAQDASNKNEPLEAGGSVAEFATVITVLIVVVCAAAALLLATQRTIEAAASPPAGAIHVPDGASPERPFHERYPVNAVVDPPTF